MHLCSVSIGALQMHCMMMMMMMSHCCDYQFIHLFILHVLLKIELQNLFPFLSAERLVLPLEFGVQKITLLLIQSSDMRHIR